MSTIKIAEEQDFDGINSVILANRSKKNDTYKFPHCFDNYRDILPTENKIIFVTIEDKYVIASLSLHNNDLYRNGNTAKFEMIVHPDYRDREKHYGEMLLNHVINYTEKETKVILLIAMVLKKNAASIHLMQKCGFSCDGEVVTTLPPIFVLKKGSKVKFTKENIVYKPDYKSVKNKS